MDTIIFHCCKIYLTMKWLNIAVIVSSVGGPQPRNWLLSWLPRHFQHRPVADGDSGFGSFLCCLWHMEHEPQSRVYSLQDTTGWSKEEQLVGLHCVCERECVWVCVFIWETDRERECVCVCVSMLIFARMSLSECNFYACR